mmetsp:Transcript_93423/g.260177  ORF Transcript_93423/g.260177 Transcript_93423/m.260177 type:complete len:275 (+) Transcript_93423:1225-2049(+)
MRPRACRCTGCRGRRPCRVHRQRWRAPRCTPRRSSRRRRRSRRAHLRCSTRPPSSRSSSLRLRRCSRPTSQTRMRRSSRHSSCLTSSSSSSSSSTRSNSSRCRCFSRPTARRSTRLRCQRGRAHSRTCRMEAAVSQVSTHQVQRARRLRSQMRSHRAAVATTKTAVLASACRLATFRCCTAVAPVPAAPCCPCCPAAAQRGWPQAAWPPAAHRWGRQCPATEVGRQTWTGPWATVCRSRARAVVVGSYLAGAMRAPNGAHAKGEGGQGAQAMSR